MSAAGGLVKVNGSGSSRRTDRSRRLIRPWLATLRRLIVILTSTLFAIARALMSLRRDIVTTITNGRR